MKKWIAFMLVLVIGFVLYGCDNDAEDLDPKINLEKSSFTLTLGDQEEVKYNIVNNDNFTVLITSSNEDIFKVVNGKIVTVAVGVAEVILTIEGIDNISIKAEVTVEAVPVKEPEFSLNKTEFVLEVAGEEEIKYTVNNLDDYELVFESSNKEVFKVVDGKIVAVNVGEGTLTVKVKDHENLTATATVKVVEEVVQKPAPRSITIDSPATEIEIGEDVELTLTFDPVDADPSVSWSTSDENIATVTQDGVLTAHAEGTVTITVISKVNDRVTRNITINIKRPIIYEDPTHVEIIASYTEFGVGNELQLTARVHPLAANSEGDGALQGVIWSTSDESVAAITATGNVTGIAAGTAIITAKSVADETIFATIEITIVVRQDGGDVVVDPEYITIVGPRGLQEVEEGKRLKLIAYVYPTGVSQSVTWSSFDESVAVVDQQGNVTGLQAGLAFIVATSNVDGTILKLHQIEVIPEVIEPPVNDMGGYSIKVMHAPHVPHEHDPYHVDYPGQDKNEKIQALEEAQTKFNVEFEFVPYPTEAPWGPPRIAWVIAQAELGTSTTDVIVSTTDWVQQLGTANATVDLTDFYDTYGKNSLDPGTVAASSYQGRLYALPHNVVGSIRSYHGLVFNVNKLNDLELENPAALFNDGEWTWSKFESYVLDAASKLPEGHSVLSGKPAGLYYGMVNAAGVILVDTIELSLNFKHPYAVTAGNLIQSLYQTDGVWGGNHWDAENPSFNNEESIFQVAEYWFLKDDGRFSETMWGEDTTLFGWAPFPHPDNVSKEDTRVSYQGGAIYQMPTGREHAHAEYGVTYEDVYRAFASMMLGTSEKQLEGGDVDEGIIMRRAAEAKIDDAASVNSIIFFKDDKVLFDPFYTVINSGDSTNGAGIMIDAIARDNQDYISVIDKHSPAYMSALLDKYGG